MASAFLIYGYVGAGKTTLARELEHAHRAVRFSSDEWVAALYGSAEGAVDDFDDALERVEAVMRTVWTRCLTLGVDVVLDSGFWARSKRDRAREAIASLGSTSILCEVTCDPDVAWARVSRRNSDLDGSVEISRATFDALRSRFQPLDEDEPHTTTTTG